MNLKEIVRPQVIFEDLIHLGNDGDGAYIVPRSALDCDELYSYGISDNITMEDDWTRLTNHKPALLYDMTVESPVLQPGMSFFKEGLSGEQTHNTNNYLNHYKKNNSSSKNILLKVDIEGNEYEWIENTDIKELSQTVYCLTMEFHWVGRYKNQFINCINKLKEYYEVVHIHGNNYAGITNDNCPEVPEMTFIRKDNYKFGGPVTCKYPIIGLDFPNNNAWADLEIDYSAV